MLFLDAPNLYIHIYGKLVHKRMFQIEKSLIFFQPIFMEKFEFNDQTQMEKRTDFTKAVTP